MRIDLDQNAYWWWSWNVKASFLLADGQTTNKTLNPFLYKAAYWDFGITINQGLYNYALVDGSYDTVDAAMMFTINGSVLAIDNSTNLNIICSDHGVEVHNDNLINELQIVQHFYVAKCKKIEISFD